jgi:hypothetical protein
VGEVVRAAANTGFGTLAAPLERLSSGKSLSIRRLAEATSRLVPRAARPDASNLTPAGAPLEVAFVWPGDDVRISVDPCPDATPRHRSETCLRATVNALTARQRSIVEQVDDWQTHHPMRFGAWLGVRATGGEIQTKLYLDVPRPAPWPAWERAFVGAPAVLPRRDVRLTMIGLDAHQGAVELYYRCAPLFPPELDTLLRRFGLRERGHEICAMVQALTLRSIRFKLPSFDMGFSCAFGEDGRPLAFTWYSTSVGLLGPPAQAQHAILRVGRARDWPMDRYASLTAAEADGSVPDHGLVGMILPRDGTMRVTATVASLPLSESLSKSLSECDRQGPRDGKRDRADA